MARHDSHEMWGQKWKISLMPHKINSDPPVVVVSLGVDRQEKRHFQLSVQSILRSLCICSSFALWLVQKTCTIYQPIKCKTKLNNTLVNLVFLFHSVYLLCTCSFHSPLMICPSVLISFQYSIKIKLIPLTITVCSIL